MKIIFPFLILVFSLEVQAARTPYGNALSGYKNGPSYLIDVADSWAGVVPGLGPAADVAKQMSDTYELDTQRFRDIISTIAYNDTSLILFESHQHIDAAFMDVSAPMTARRTHCIWEDAKCDYDRQSVILSGRVFGHISRFDSKQNGGFNTQTGGTSIGAKAYLSEGFLLGASYARSTTDTKDNIIYADTISNSMTAFAQYLSKGGAFVNAGVIFGHTSWTMDKSSASIQSPDDYDTDFFAGQLTTGIKLNRGMFFISPQLGARYSYLTTEKHTDSIVQTFHQWNRDTLSAQAGLRLGLEFLGADFAVRPSLLFGGSYDVLTDGDKFVRVELINDSSYFIPVEVPGRTAFNTGIGLMFDGPMFSIGLDYKFDMGKDFTSHTAKANLRLAF